MFQLKKFKNPKAGILGLGRSGRAVAQLLAQKGVEVLISEEAPIAHVDSLGLPPKVKVETGGHSSKLFECDFWVKSPGIFPKSPILLEGKRRKLGEILKADAALKKDRAVFVCGNIGNPVSHCVSEVHSGDDVVIEVSSYQLEDSTYFRPKYACVLNITPDHLDHHNGMKNYCKAKAKIFKNQRANDFLILNGADSICVQFPPKIKSTVLAFSTQPKHALKTDVFFDGDEIIFSEGYRIRPPHLKGIHNVENAMAAALMALAAGVSAETIQHVFETFAPMEHRIEPFAYHKGVVYINDSKATNLDSTITALKSFEKTPAVWLILGGRDKGASYEVLLPYLKTYCKRVLTIGEAMDKIERELGNYPVTRCTTLENAVQTAMQGAKKGDIVLLSPACSSFDQFKDYEQRGKIFKQLVNARIFNDRTK